MKQKIKNLDEGIKYMLLASLMFAFMGAFAKLASQNLPSLEVVFFRNIAGVILISIAILKKPLNQKGGKPLLLLFRGSMGFLALLTFFYLIAHIPLGDAMTWSKTSPIFVAVFAWLFLGEKLSKKGWIAVFIGFVGIVFIAKPSGLGFSKYDLLGLFSGIGAALAYTSIRELKKFYETRAIAMSFMAVGTIGPIVLFSIAPYVETKEFDFMFAKFIMPQGIEWFYLISMGIIATISQLLMTKAYSATKAGIIGAISYTNILFATIVGVMLGDDLPDIFTTIGIVLIVVAGVMVAKEK
jgi:drug/metabolite transporter (DMT)-like permease